MPLKHSRGRITHKHITPVKSLVNVHIRIVDINHVSESCRLFAHSTRASMLTLERHSWVSGRSTICSDGALFVRLIPNLILATLDG